MLYPKSNKYRDVYNLNGIWKFKTAEEDYCPTVAAQNCEFMAVPASYNEITTRKSIRDHVGKVLYERTFSVPVREGREYRLRIGATSHKCEIYLNGEKIGEGLNGFLPIDLPLKSLREENRLSVVIDNRLTFQTFPVGQVVDGKQIIQHDFYNFTGIHRDVLLYALPEKHIEDIAVQTAVDGDYGKIFVAVKTTCKSVRCRVRDRDGAVVAEGNAGELMIPSPHTWCPEAPYLYTLVVETECDKYEEKFGIRKVEVNGDKFLLNGKPVYFKGFGMHEDFFVLGKGNNAALNVRDFELLKWIHANSFRTSHYPYSEEIMDLADEYGILVIDEVPAVGMNWWGEKNFAPEKMNEETKRVHKELLRLLWERDKNHPSVVMVSVANEAATHEESGREYFADVIPFARNLTGLPITLAEFTKFADDKVGGLVDVICLNRYYGWYETHGMLEGVSVQLKAELCQWHEKYGKPIVMTEFGADTIEGLHTCPSETFSEEYQKEYIEENCKAMDECSFCIGEHVWNFADFKTKQGVTRFRGNRKGVFTKERQPKFAAHYLKERWKDK